MNGPGTIGKHILESLARQATLACSVRWLPRSLPGLGLTAWGVLEVTVPFLQACRDHGVTGQGGSIQQCGHAYGESAKLRVVTLAGSSVSSCRTSKTSRRTP